MVPDLAGVALQSLGHSKMRTMLTMLGMIIGVGAVIAMVAIGHGARAAVQAQIASLGTNILMVFSGSSSRGGVHGGMGSVVSLSADDAKAIAATCDAVAYSMPTVRTGAQVVAGDKNWSTNVQGVGPEYVDIRAWPVETGSFFTDTDVRASAKVCVLGKSVATSLFEDRNPVGSVIRIKKIPFTVIGVLARKGGSVMGSDQDDTIIAPHTTVQRKLMGAHHIGMIMVSAVSPDKIPAAQQQISEVLRARHRIARGEEDDFTVRNQTDISSAAEASSRVMTILLGGIASVSLVVGGIGIMNIMLVSVTERTREIGIRRAIGGRKRDILIQFLIEAILLSVIGGFIGIALGIGGSMVISRLAGWPSAVTPDSVILAFCFSAAIGVFFGLYPAKKAAGLDPIDALRYE